MTTSKDILKVPKKYGADIRLLATALVDIFKGSSLDENPFGDYLECSLRHSGLKPFNEMWQEIYVYIPEPEENGVPLTVRFNCTKEEDRVTELYMGIDQGNTHIGNSRKIILPKEANDEEVNLYITMVISNIASVSGTTPEKILDAMEKVTKNKTRFEDLSKQYRKLDIS